MVIDRAQPPELLSGDDLLGHLSVITGIRAVPATPAARRTAAVLRRLVAAAATGSDLNLDRSDVVWLEVLADRVERVAVPRSRFDDLNDDEFPMGTHPMTGSANPIAPPMCLALHDHTVIGRTIFGPQHEGYRGTVFGGQVAAAFDAILGVAAATCGSPVVSRDLRVRFEKPIAIGIEVVFQASIQRVDDREVSIEAEAATASAGRSATASALFRQVRSQRRSVDL